MSELSAEDAQRLVRSITQVMEMARHAIPPFVAPLTKRLREHLGIDESVPNTSIVFNPIERANLQLALDRLRADSSSWDEVGLTADIANYGGVSLPAFVAGSFHGPVETARQFVSVQVSATETIRCLQAGVVLTEHVGVPVAVMVYQSDRRGMPELIVEVAATTQEAADGFLSRLQVLMTELNVLRGKVVTFAYGEYGGFGLTFTVVPPVQRSEVILPEWQLDAIDEHAVGITDVRDRLLAAGQHLKRGLLLYGPPGTGKTHTVSYLIGQMTDRTTIILSGASVGAVGQAGTLARKLAPATIVIEDVDLIGMDRGLPGGEHNPMLFQLLNEMDGLQADDDVLFVLTTNRADLLEPALAARPGRIDQALEIGLPDAEGRRALFTLYLGAANDGEAIDGVSLDRAVDGTDGAAAAYIKELARRATLRSIRSQVELGDALVHTVDQMHVTASPLLRAALAAGSTGPPGAASA
jgi:cell division protease FtsH